MKERRSFMLLLCTFRTHDENRILIYNSIFLMILIIYSITLLYIITVESHYYYLFNNMSFKVHSNNMYDLHVYIHQSNQYKHEDHTYYYHSKDPWRIEILGRTSMYHNSYIPYMLIYRTMYDCKRYRSYIVL